jgi:peptide/nickel transport system substrate-binding protein
MERMTARGLKRREFLQLGAATAALGLLQACSSAAPPAPTAAPKPAETAKPATQATTAPAATAAPAAAATQAPATPKPAAGPKKGGTITTAQTDTFYTFDPFQRNWYRVRRTLFNTLAHYDQTLTLQPELATKWDISPDGKTVTFKLREDVKYHSGRPFTSEDMKFSMEYATGSELSLQRPIYQTIKSMETPDKYTFVMKFDSPNAGVFDLIDCTHAVDKESVKDFANNGVGTGPFKLEKYVPNDRFEAVAFKDYWDKGKPYADRYVARLIPDVSALAVNLESAAIDAAFRISYLDAVRIKGLTGKFVVDMGPGGENVFDIGLNTKLEPFTDKRVRQAVAWCMDRSRFAKTVIQGLTDPTCLIWPPSSWAYQKDLQGKIGYDLEKAKALLKDAGLANGFETEILTASKRSFGYGDLAVMLQSDLAKVGIKAKVADVEVAQYDARTQKGDIAILAHVYGRANLDPITTLTGAKAWFTEAEKGWTHFESDEYTKLKKDLSSTLEREKRLPMVRRIQELALDECFTIPVAEGPVPWGLASYIKNWTVDMQNNPFLGEVWLDK